MQMLGRIWNRSILRFYWLNAKWNLGFWMNAKPVYEDRTYTYTEDDLDLDKNLDDLNMQFKLEQKRGSYKRFKGYIYRNGLYLDNPGAQCSVDKETRTHWFNKRWI